MSKGELAVEAGSGAVDSKGLKGGALGLVSSIVVGMASTAPAYSLAASLGLVVAAGGVLLAGVKAPAILLLAFIPMYLIAVAYQELNKAEPDCGTTFTWASRAFGPLVGWMGGPTSSPRSVQTCSATASWARSACCCWRPRS